MGALRIRTTSRSRAKAPGNLHTRFYIDSGRQPSYTEQVVVQAMLPSNPCRSLITSCSCEIMYKALPLFHTASEQRAMASLYFRASATCLIFRPSQRSGNENVRGGHSKTHHTCTDATRVTTCDCPKNCL